MPEWLPYVFSVCFFFLCGRESKVLKSREVRDTTRANLKGDQLRPLAIYSAQLANTMTDLRQIRTVLSSATLAAAVDVARIRILDVLTRPKPIRRVIRSASVADGSACQLTENCVFIVTR